MGSILCEQIIQITLLVQGRGILIALEEEAAFYLKKFNIFI